MRLLLLSLFLAAPAFAQEVGQELWLTEDAQSVRFMDDTTAGPGFPQGKKVKVLYVDGDTVRVTAGKDFGWLSASLLTAEAPATSAPVAPSVETFDLEALKKMLDEKQEL